MKTGIVVFLVSLFSCAGLAQQLGFGIKGGIRATNDVQGSSGVSSESPRYVVGPMIEVKLPRGFAMEADALYSRLGYRSQFGNFAGSSIDGARGTSWEFPLLIKHGLSLPLIHPYMELGYAARRTNGSIHSTGETINLNTGARQTFSFDRPWRSLVSHGLVAGGGAEFSMGAFRIAPEVRYTCWNQDILNREGSHESQTHHLQ